MDSLGQRLNEAYFQDNDYWFKFDNNAPSVPFVSVPGFSLGGSSNFPQGDDGYRLHLKDNFSWIRGIISSRRAARLASTDRQPSWRSTSRAPTRSQASRRSSRARRRATRSRWVTLTFRSSSNIFAGFIQDDWRPFRSLTLNFGVRYDYTDAKVPELVPGLVVDVGSEFLPLKGQQDPAISRDKNNVSPRFGFTWSPDPKWAIYGGTGLYYDQVILNNYVSTLFGAPRRISVAIDNPIFPYPPSLLPTTPGAPTTSPTISIRSSRRRTTGIRRSGTVVS